MEDQATLEGYEWLENLAKTDPSILADLLARGDRSHRHDGSDRVQPVDGARVLEDSSDRQLRRQGERGGQKMTR